MPVHAVVGAITAWLVLCFVRRAAPVQAAA
jgi:hypothetical protein